MGSLDLGDVRADALERLTDALSREPDVIAAWLTGADGRGEADEWSDFDLSVAVADEQWLTLADRTSALLHSLGPPALVQGGFPSDSIPGGRYWLAVYAGPATVDWNIGQVSLAIRPPASTLLVERREIPVAPVQPAALTAGDICEQVEPVFDFFWAMAPIAYKYAGRGHTGLAVRHAGMLRGALERLWEAMHTPWVLADTISMNRPLDPRLDSAMPRFEPLIDPKEAVRVIDALCAAVEGMHDDLRGLGVNVPDRMPGLVAETAALARASASIGGTRPTIGSRR